MVEKSLNELLFEERNNVELRDKTFQELIGQDGCVLLNERRPCPLLFNIMRLRLHDYDRRLRSGIGDSRRETFTIKESLTRSEQR